MSYFDHVRCHSCQAMLNPESLGGAQGGMCCPRCGAALNLTDLFGLADAFSESDTPEVGLDDLIPSGPLSAYAHDPITGTAQRATQAPSRGQRRAPAPRPARSAASAPSPHAGQMVHQPHQEEEDMPSASPSALELMRRMKRKR